VPVAKTTCILGRFYTPGETVFIWPKLLIHCSN